MSDRALIRHTESPCNTFVVMENEDRVTRGLDSAGRVVRHMCIEKQTGRSILCECGSTGSFPGLL